MSNPGLSLLSPSLLISHSPSLCIFLFSSYSLSLLLVSIKTVRSITLASVSGSDGFEIDSRRQPSQWKFQGNANTPLNSASIQPGLDHVSLVGMDARRTYSLVHNYLTPFINRMCVVLRYHLLPTDPDALSRLKLSLRLRAIPRSIDWR